MQVSLFVPRYCVLCVVLQPRLTAFCRKRGIDLSVWKVNAKGIGRRVGGPYKTINAKAVPAFPAMIIGNDPTIIVGAGILHFLRDYLNKTTVQ